VQAGDMLMNIAGRQYESVLLDALAFRSERPTEWREGETLYYTVMREGAILQVDVPLLRLTGEQILANLGRNLLLNPGPLLTLLVAFFVFFRLPASRPAQLMLLFSAAVFASDGVSQIISGSNVAGPAELFYPWAFWLSQLINSFIWPFLIGPWYIHLFLSFLLPLRHTPRRILLALYGLMPVVTLLAWLYSGGKTLAFWYLWARLSFYDFVFILGLSIVCMIYMLARAGDAARNAQIRWVAWGILITSLAALSGSLFIVFGLQGEILLAAWVLTRLMLLAFPVALAIAILRYRLFDIDVVIRGTLVYAALTSLLGAIYMASVVLFQFLFRMLAGDTSPLAVVVSTLLIAGLFFPLRRRLQDGIDRRMYRRKYNAEHTIEAFGLTVRDEVDLKQLTEQLMGVVAETMQPITLSLWMCSSKTTSPESTSESLIIAAQPSSPGNPSLEIPGFPERNS
jgi:hypothetical protein